MKILLRILSSIFLFAGLFFVPWGLVFVGLIFVSAVFSWYVEGLLIGFALAFLGDIAFWKIFLILAPVILVQEKLKLSMNFSKPVFVRVWLWFAGILVFIADFFVFI